MVVTHCIPYAAESLSSARTGCANRAELCRATDGGSGGQKDLCFEHAQPFQAKRGGQERLVDATVGRLNIRAPGCAKCDDRAAARAAVAPTAVATALLLVH